MPFSYLSAAKFTTFAATRISSTAAIYMRGSGIPRTDICYPRHRMKLFRSVLARRSKRESDKVVRLYQSETAEFLERPAPLRARITIFAFTSLLITILVAASLLHIDRVVSSTFGQV